MLAWHKSMARTVQDMCSGWTCAMSRFCLTVTLHVALPGHFQNPQTGPTEPSLRVWQGTGQSSPVAQVETACLAASSRKAVRPLFSRHLAQGQQGRCCAAARTDFPVARRHQGLESSSCHWRALPFSVEVVHLQPGGASEGRFGPMGLRDVVVGNG